MGFFENYCSKSEDELQKECLRLTSKRLQHPTALPTKLLIKKTKDLSIYYAPMSIAMPRSPKILIAGLTPGWDVAKEAYLQFSEAGGDLQVYRRLSKSVAFKGTMRGSIFSFFESIGITQILDFQSAQDLFSSSLVGSTSILRYPVFKGSQLENYSGSSDVLSDPFLSSMVKHLFMDLVLKKRDALVVPMGKWPGLVLREMIELDPTLRSRVLWGFPHMSGANNGRKGPALEAYGTLWKKTVKAWARARW